MSIPDIVVKAASGLLSIGGLSEVTGASPRSLRYYEEQGLITPQRTAAGHRRYDSDAVDQVILVQRMFSAGLSSAEIQPILPGMIDEEHRTGLLVAELRGFRHRLHQDIARQLDAIDILDEVIEEYDGS